MEHLPKTSHGTLAQDNTWNTCRRPHMEHLPATSHGRLAKQITWNNPPWMSRKLRGGISCHLCGGLLPSMCVSCFDFQLGTCTSGWHPHQAHGCQVTISAKHVGAWPPLSTKHMGVWAPFPTNTGVLVHHSQPSKLVSGYHFHQAHRSLSNHSPPSTLGVGHDSHTDTEDSHEPLPQELAMSTFVKLTWNTFPRQTHGALLQHHTDLT